MNADILTALLEHCASMVIGSPVMPIAMPEQAPAFVPPDDGRYLDVMVFANVPAWEGQTSGIARQGLLQVTVVWPPNRGVVAPQRIADVVCTYFPKGLVLFSGSAKVKITREPYAASPLTEPSDVRIPVTIPWMA